MQRKSGIDQAGGENRTRAGKPGSQEFETSVQYSRSSRWNSWDASDGFRMDDNVVSYGERGAGISNAVGAVTAEGKKVKSAKAMQVPRASQVSRNWGTCA